MNRLLGGFVALAWASAMAIVACSSSTSSVGTGDGGGGGGDGGAGGGDGGGGGACAPGGAVAHFVLQVAAGGATFCDGSGCGSNFLSISKQDGTQLSIDYSCGALCTDCQPVGCTGSCEAPSVIGASGAQRQWNGTYYVKSTCGQGTTCGAPTCVEPGTYVAHMCGYRYAGDAAPTNTFCGGATSSSPTCTDVTFTWPPSSSPITGTIGP